MFRVPVPEINIIIDNYDYDWQVVNKVIVLLQQILQIIFAKNFIRRTYLSFEDITNNAAFTSVRALFTKA